MKDFIDILVQATGKILVLRHIAGAGPGCNSHQNLSLIEYMCAA